MKPLAICTAAFALICAAWAVHPALGILVGMLAIGAVEGLLSE